MYTKSSEEQKAQYLYLQTNLTQQEIADLLSINRRTLYNWIREGSWKRAKYIAKYAPPLLAEQYYTQLGALNAEIALRKDRPYPTREEADIIRKLTISIKHVQGDRDPIVSDLSTFIDFAHEMRRKDKNTAEQLIGHMDDYIQTRLKEGSSMDSGWRAFLKEKDDELEYEEWQRNENYRDMNRKSSREEAVANGNRHMPFVPEKEAESNSRDSTNEQVNGQIEIMENPSEALTGNAHAADDNTQNTQTKSEEQENSYKGAGPVYYTGFLEECYNISKDPHVKRYTTATTGITIIKSPSPLWGHDKCLFFNEKNRLD